jgi:hypothetical protein
MKSDPLQPAPLPQPARHGLEPATRNLKPVTRNLFHTHVFENKIAAQLPLSNQIDTRQSNLSTTVSKQSLTQWNQILKRRGAPSPIFERNTTFRAFPRHRDPSFPTSNRRPDRFEGHLQAISYKPQAPSTQLPGSRAPSYPLSAPGSPLSITKQNARTTSTLESNT